MLIKANGLLKICIAADMLIHIKLTKKNEQTKRKRKTWSQIKIIFY